LGSGQPRGCGGNLGTEIVVRAIPDGHTVLLGFSTILTVNPNLYRLPFSMQRDLQPVTTLDIAQFLGCAARASEHAGWCRQAAA
jgi:tripartite-type tricarboxylate transporter receptor subunit TctC